MLRAISCVYYEAQVLRRNELLKVLCSHRTTSCTVRSDSTVLSQDSRHEDRHGAIPPQDPPLPQEPPSQGPPPPRSRRAFAVITALTFTASLGGMYLYKKIKQESDDDQHSSKIEGAEDTVVEECIPARADDLPAHTQFLLVGGGTASFAAMRAIRSARPEAQVLLVSTERAPPYMRPPLTKELWREADLSERARSPERLAFRQWNGRRRALLYEPPAFYTPPERLRDAPPGAGLALGWRVLALDPTARTASLLSASGERATLTYDRCLVANVARPRRLAALRDLADAGLALPMHSLEDVAALADKLEAPKGERTVAVVGGGTAGAELAAALSERARVLHVYRESAPLAALLPPYLASEAARALAALGVQTVAGCEVTGGAAKAGRARLECADGAVLEADAVVECVGTKPDTRLAMASRLETHEAMGGLVVNAELAARSGLWVAGDAACYFDEALGRRRLERHDHAVASGRLAGENMVAERPRPYTHQSMFWSDLGPNLGYEAIGVIDSKLETVGVFCEDAVREAIPAAAEAGHAVAHASSGDKHYERGVVFYLQEKRVVGILLWNLFNRMHLARQVLARGEFDDLFEVAKLFALHEQD